MKTILNIVGLQLGWFACVISAANGVPLIGVAIVLVYLAIHLKSTDFSASEIQLIIAVAILGTVVDGSKKAFGILKFASDIEVAWLAPIWITMMYALFATTLNHSLSWLKGKYVLAAVLGAILGPLSYIGGGRLGAAIFIMDFTSAVIYLAIIWGILIPLFVWLASFLEKTYRK